MKSLLLVGLAAASPTMAGYALLLPLISGYLDQRFGLAWAPPDALRLLGAASLLVGVTIAGWAVYSLSRRQKHSPASLESDELVSAGPYRFSRNPLFLACGVAGFGLAFLIGSPTLILGYLAVAAGAVGYVLTVEEPLLEKRFGAEYAEYAQRTPRWVGPARV